DGNLTVRASSLLGFDPTLNLKQSIVPGFLTLIGTGKFLASSNGPVHFMEPPVRVDPQALVGWADCPSPCHHYDHTYMEGVMGAIAGMLRQNSGEEHQLDFTGAGTVIMQSSEKTNDTGMLRSMQSQVGGLGLPGLQQLQATVQSRIAQESQSSY
ncbi:MAG: AIM24 family protein, partial [Herbiconiux sp.]|nr:AIM24 family protein [Herbiconiux sp.]